MTLWPLTFEIIVTFLISSLLLYHYGNWSEQNIAIILSVFISWFFSFIVIFILPLDITSTAYRQCIFHTNLTIHYTTTQAPQNVTDFNSNSTTSEIYNSTLQQSETIPDSIIIAKVCGEPWSYANKEVLLTLWSLVYWTIQVLTWFVLPIMQSYSMAGEFSRLGKLKSSFIENAIYYSILGTILFIIFAYVAIRSSLDWASIKVICITASNTAGLFLLVILLGYGLVEIPRSCFNTSQHNRSLNYCYFRVAKISAEKCEADGKLEDVLDQIAAAYPVTLGSSPYKYFMTQILKKCPSSWTENLIKRFTSNPDSCTEQRPSSTYSEKSFVRMNQLIKKSTQTHHRVHVQWNNAIKEAINWEDVVRNELNHVPTFKPTFKPPFKIGYWRTIKDMLYSPEIEWYWKCKFRGPFYLFLSYTLAILSCIFIISELFLSIHNTPMNLFAYFFKNAKKNDCYILIELVSILSLSYLCICTYYTVFKIRIFNYYYLASHHQTDESSLIFSAMLLCRLTPALCLNFLRLINLDSHMSLTFPSDIEQASFTQIMGHMDVLSFIRDGIDIYLPLLMCLFCAATYFKFGSMLLHYMDIEQFIIDDEVTLELIREGKDLVQREKNKRLLFVENVSRQRGAKESPLESPLESSIESLHNFKLNQEEYKKVAISEDIGNTDHTNIRSVQDYKSFEKRVPHPKDLFNDL